MLDLFSICLGGLCLSYVFISCSIRHFRLTISVLAVCTLIVWLVFSGWNWQIKIMLCIDLLALLIKSLSNAFLYIARLIILYDAHKHPERYHYRHDMVFNKKTGKLEVTSEIIFPF